MDTQRLHFNSKCSDHAPRWACRTVSTSDPKSTAVSGPMTAAYGRTNHVTMARFPSASTFHPRQYPCSSATPAEPNEKASSPPSTRQKPTTMPTHLADPVFLCRDNRCEMATGPLPASCLNFRLPLTYTPRQRHASNGTPYARPRHSLSLISRTTYQRIVVADHWGLFSSENPRDKVALP